MEEEMDFKKYKKSSYSAEARKTMDEIKEKGKNTKTQIEALELIEQHLGEISPIFLFYTKDLSESENQEVREKAEVVLKKYHEKPEFREMSEKMDDLRRSLTLKNEWSKFNILEEIQFNSKDSELPKIHEKLDKILKKLEELKKSNQIKKEEYEYFEKINKELNEAVYKAYQ